MNDSKLQYVVVLCIMIYARARRMSSVLVLFGIILSLNFTEKSLGIVGI